MSETVSQTRRKSTQGRYRRPTWRSLVVIVSGAAALSVYLFVTAPPPLAAERPQATTVPIRTVFALLERENDAARALWTQEIVAAGKAVGLAFDERWRDERVFAGPLPALFLRETARNLERSSLRLGLFLGSQFPIASANQFTGEQTKHFEALVQHGTPQYFTDPTTGLHTAMFADVAVDEACVSCHNEHERSPKSDWALHDVMGATTWMYPDAHVTVDRAIELVGALRTSIRRAYASYLEKVATFPSRPKIGSKWPRHGFALPSEDEFMRELARRSPTSTVLALLDPAAAELDEPERPVAAAAAPPAKRSASAAGARDEVLVIRTGRSTRVTVERGGSRLLVARLAAGAVTTLTSPPPLRVQLTNPASVQIEYGGRPVAIPEPEAGSATDGVEVIIGAVETPEKS